jgi:hypothetical protein
MAALRLFRDEAGRLAYDPDGRFYGVPVYVWREAPDGLATRRQLSAKGLRPAGQPVAAQVWRPRRRRGPLVAHLFREELARPKRKVTAAMLAAVRTAVAARRICSGCGIDAGYVVPQYTGRECFDCYDVRKAVA